MEAAWIPVVGTLVGVGLGGGLQYLYKYLDRNNERERDLRNLRIARLEDLHFLLGEASNEIRIFASAAVLLCDVNVSPMQRRTEIVTLIHSLTQKMHVIESKASLHFDPFDDTKVAKLIRLTSAVTSSGHKFVQLHLEEYVQDEERNRIAQNLTQASVDLQDFTARVQRDVATETKGLMKTKKQKR